MAKAKTDPYSGASFLDLIKSVPVDQFVRMVTKSGIPALEARKLCEEFKKLKAS